MLPFTTRTNRFRRWKKSANPKKLPLKVNVSGTWVSPGVLAADEAAPPCGAVDPGPEAGALACAWLVLLACVTPLPAFWACLPGQLCAGAEPGAAGLWPPPTGV